MNIVSRQLAHALSDPSFAITGSLSYRNTNGRPGLRLVGRVGGTQVYISQSHTAAPLSSALLIRILSAPDYLDQTKSIIYTADRRLGPGIRIEAWYCGRWYQVFVPIFRGSSIPGFVAEILQLTNMLN